MSPQLIHDLSAWVHNGELFTPPGDHDRVEAFIPTPYGENHAANLVELPNGDLLCAWFAGTEEGASDVKVVVARLPVDGDRWTHPIRLSDDPNRSEQNPVLFAAPDGAIHLFYTAQETRGGSRSEWEARRARGEVMGGFCAQWTAVVRHRVSADNGVTWGPIETPFRQPGSFCRQPLLVMSNGEWLFPFYYSLPDAAGTHGNDYSVMQISGDDGRNWREFPVPCSRGRVHASVVELTPGHLTAFFRSRAADRIYIGHSTDYGRTWTEPVRTALPNNNASIQARKLHSGALALVFNQFSAQEKDPDGTFWPRRRWPLTVALSEDEGVTWPVMRHLDTGDDFCGTANVALNRRLSYPCLIQAHTGELHVAYSYRDRQCIKYIRFTEAWIRQQRSDLATVLGWR